MLRKTLSIFDINTKIEAIFLFILNFFSALLEIISIGSIPIFLYYVLEPDKLISKIPFENVQLFVGEFFKNNSTSENLFLILIPIVIIFVFKNILLFSINIYQVYFSRKIKTRYTTLLFKKYIYEKYDFFLDKNPAQFIKNLDSNQEWQPPISEPARTEQAKYLSWDEDNLRWLGTKKSDNSNYRWDADNTQWVSV